MLIYSTIQWLNMVRPGVTRVPLTKATREILKKIGSKAETYDQIILHMVKEAGYKEKATYGGNLA